MQTDRLLKILNKNQKMLSKRTILICCLTLCRQISMASLKDQKVEKMFKEHKFKTMVLSKKVYHLLGVLQLHQKECNLKTRQLHLEEQVLVPQLPEKKLCQT